MGIFKEIKKAVAGQRQGFSYRGDSFGHWDSVKTGTELYYKLYRKNTDLRRCVEELSQTLGKDGFSIINEDWDIVENDDLIDSLNNIYDFDEFKSQIIRDLIIWGNVYIVKVPNPLGTTAGYQLLDPRTIRIIANKHGEVLKYIQVSSGGNSQNFTADEVYQYKDSIDHDNEVFGISKVETLVYDILWDEEAGKSNYSFFKNNAIPSSVIILDNELDENEINLAMDSLKKNFSGGENRHRISANTGIKDIKVLGNTMKDMEFTVLRGFTTEKICSAMGVPKTVLWYSDNVNYSTSDNQYRKFIENTIRPLSKKVENIINELIGDDFPWYYIKFIDNNEYDLQEKIERFWNLLDRGMITINEARTELGREPLDSPYADVALIKQGYEPLDDVWLNNTLEPDAEQ